MRFPIFILFICSFSASAQVGDPDSLAAFYNARADRYLKKDKAVQDFYSITPEGVSVYSGLETKQKQAPEFSFGWDELAVLKLLLTNSDQELALDVYQTKGDQSIKTVFQMHAEAGGKTPAGKKKLAGRKIAIAPGHFASSWDMAFSEGKCIDIRQNANAPKVPIKFYESALTLRTAYLLKAKLEEAGADVFMIRDSIHTNTLGVDFEDWFSNDFSGHVAARQVTGEFTASDIKFWEKADKGFVMRHYFASLERELRIEKINEYSPDATIVIHFNVDETNKPWQTATNKNFNMAFVPGSILSNELKRPVDRMRFIRQLFTEQVSESIALSAACMDEFATVLKVPAAKQTDASYLEQFCIPASDNGVYCRNLALTSGLVSPLVYGETLYQDNEQEIYALSNPNGKRLEQVATAYFNGIIRYFNPKKTH
jgi:N-acetylmuramoyl-L-alanine amidase